MVMNHSLLKQTINLNFQVKFQNELCNNQLKAHIDMYTIFNGGNRYNFLKFPTLRQVPTLTQT